jgi:integrase
VANRRVTLVINAKSEKGWRRFPAVLSKNGRVRSGYGVVQGEPAPFTQFRYELRMFEGSNLVYKPAGLNAQDAQALQQREQRKKSVRSEAIAAGIGLIEEETRTALRSAADRYVQRTKDAQAPKAAVVYRTALDHFLEAVTAQYVDEVDDDVLLSFHAALRRRGNGARTIANKHAAVKGFLIWAGADPKAIGKRKPRYEKRVPVVYGGDEMGTLLSSNDNPYFAVVLDVLRMAGLREQEAMHLQWPDIDFNRGLLLVRSKPKMGFLIKDKEERDVPMPDALVKVLQEWRAGNRHTQLVLGTKGDRPNRKWLRSLKRLARKAKLNCNRCDACRKRQECEHWTLHSFRRSYATQLAQNGVDVRTIMALMGHSDLQTVLKYLAPMQTKAAAALVNQVKW